MEHQSYSFGTTLKALRRRAGLTQSQLADQVGVGQTAVSQWERADSTPTITHLLLIADALRVGVVDLLEYEDDPDNDFPTVAEIEAYGARRRRQADALLRERLDSLAH